MKLFASHFGCYEVEHKASGPELRPFRHDVDASALGTTYLELARHPTRIPAPLVRRGWLKGDGGTARGNDRFVAIPLDEAAELAAKALRSVSHQYGNESIYGGSYGWGSAGQFHQSRTQLHRLLNLAGGHVSSRHTYSFGAAEVLLPHLVGSEFANPSALAPTWDAVIEAKPIILCFGGMRLANAQIGAGGVGSHTTREWIERFDRVGGTMITVSPDRRDAPVGTHVRLNAGSDVYAIQAIAYAILAMGAEDEAFLTSRCSGWPEVRSLLLGETDGIARTPEWAQAATGVSPDRWRELAGQIVEGPSLINLSWSLQRAYAGEQPYWAALTLSAMCGQPGRHGCGFACGLSATASVGSANRRLGRARWDDSSNAVDRFIPVARLADMLERPGGKYRYDGTEQTYPDIRLVWWAGGNPFHHHQDLNRLARAWRAPDTVIVQDPVWTATAQHADIVFPASLPFERNDIVAGTRDNWAVLSRKVQDPPPGVLNDHDVLCRIAAHLGLEDRFTGGCSEWRWLRRIYASYRRAYPELPDWERFQETGFARLDPLPGTSFEQPLAGFVLDPNRNPLDTASGRIDLFPVQLAHASGAGGVPLQVTRSADHGEPALPLRLLSPQPEHRLHSQLDGAAPARAARIDGREVVRLHPLDLEVAGLGSQSTVELFNERGCVLVVAIADEQVAPGHVVLPTGGWYAPRIDPTGRRIDVGGNPNTLTRDVGVSELSQGASAGIARVGIRAIDARLRDWMVQLTADEHRTGWQG